MWLLEKSVHERLETVVRSGFVPSMDDQLRFEARHNSGAAGGLGILTVAGSTAEINISGVLTNKPDFLAMIFGGGNVTYPDIISAIAEAEADDSITDIVLAIDSSGGMIDGLFSALDAIQGATKKVTAFVDNVAASAAYALASQADEIVARNRATRVGSIGIIGMFKTNDETITLRSTEAPNKNPDPTTDEGQEIIQAQLDDMHELFVQAIATGRDTDADTVNRTFGRGATMLAADAIKANMIDRVAEPAFRVVGQSEQTVAADGDGDKMEANTMKDLNEFKAAHPDLFAQAVQVGVDQERDRVEGHLIYGKESGAMDLAMKAIEDGSEITNKLLAQYMTAGKNKSDEQDRADDDSDLGAADNVAPVPEDETVEREKEASDLIAKRTFALCGREFEGAVQ